jgi:S1-C subfamily serine protease
MKEIAFALLYVLLLPVLAYGSAQEVANQLFPKTVLLNTKDTSGRPLALGSGFVLKKGYIVTNYHVVEGAGSGLVRRIGDKTQLQNSWDRCERRISRPSHFGS